MDPRAWKASQGKVTALGLGKVTKRARPRPGEDGREGVSMALSARWSIFLTLPIIMEKVTWCLRRGQGNIENERRENSNPRVCIKIKGNNQK